MHGMHARLPKNFVLEERLERYSRLIETSPASYAGDWAKACHPLLSEGPTDFARVHVDLGCGKGAYVVREAARHPDTLYLALDGEPICIAYTAQHAIEAGLSNIVAIPALGSHVTQLFAPREIDAITLNFPTPYPRKKDADKRLTILERLMDYRQILAPDGFVRLKTDSYPLWRFSQIQFELAGYELLWSSQDARADRPDDTPTEYEERLSAQGAKVYALEAQPGSLLDNVEQTASLSLVDYLPANLDALDYVPHGMQGTITNLRNQRRRMRQR